MFNINSNYHGVSKITIKKEPKTDEHPFEYLYITLSSASGDNNSIVVFGKDSELDVELEGKYGNYAI